MENGAVFLEMVKKGNKAGVEKMLQADPTLALVRDENGVPAVLLALYYGRPDISRSIAAKKPDLDLFEAAALGNVPRLKELIQASPGQVNEYSPDGFQALHLAAFFDQPAAASELIRRGADVDTHSRNGQKVTPLHSAAAANSVGIVASLLEAGADANARQEGGFTPLHAAAQNGSLEITRLLVEHGADVSARTSQNQSALDFARQAKAAEVIAYLESPGRE